LYLVQIFRASPLMALALCVCLGTIMWCILLARRQQVGLDRLLTALLGLIAIYEALRLLKEAGIILFPGSHKLDGWVDFIIASLYLFAAMILKASSSDRASTKVRLRLVEANEKTMELGKLGVASALEPSIVFDGSPLATFAQDSSGVVIYWNTAAERLFGWNRDEIIGQRLPYTGACPLLDKQGREIEAAVWHAPIRPPNGPVRGTLTIVADSSALRAAGLDVAHRVHV
jgi:PAS domain-containing protein